MCVVRTMQSAYHYLTVPKCKTGMFNLSVRHLRQCHYFEQKHVSWSITRDCRLDSLIASVDFSIRFSSRAGRLSAPVSTRYRPRAACVSAPPNRAPITTGHDRHRTASLRLRPPRRPRRRHLLETVTGGGGASFAAAGTCTRPRRLLRAARRRPAR